MQIDRWKRLAANWLERSVVIASILAESTIASEGSSVKMKNSNIYEKTHK
jgi:hypothetical protein